MKFWIATCLIAALSNTACAEFSLQLRTQVTDLGGTEISSIAMGQQFKLQTIATDIRNPPRTNPFHRGVNSAGVDISYDSFLSSLDTTQSIEYGAFFNLFQVAQLEPGRIQAFAASAEFRGPGNDPQFLFSVVLTAERPGLQAFTPTLLSWPDTPNGIYTDDIPLPLERIEFVGASVLILPEPSAFAPAAIAIASLFALGRRRVSSRRLQQ